MMFPNLEIVLLLLVPPHLHHTGGRRGPPRSRGEGGDAVLVSP